MVLYALPVSVWCNFCPRVCEVRWNRHGYMSCPECGKILAQIWPQDVGRFREEYERLKGLLPSNAVGPGPIEGAQDG